MNLTLMDARLRILVTAKKLFAKQGYDGTSVREISKEAGTNLAMISYYFGGKDQIFEALFETFMPLDRVDKMGVSQQDEPAEELRLLMGDMLEFRLKDPEIINILRHEMNLRTVRYEIVQRHILPMYAKIQGVLQRGRAANVFHFESLDTILLFVMASIFAHSSRSQIALIATEEGQPTYEELLRDLTAYVLRGLGVQQSSIHSNTVPQIPLSN
ncbi:TetR/AcrR family transcriptional regulator [Cohnella abietis]|uniref:TetR family transcriptional regulator n=1 Tax=Cohnella abietis TaxID=2507935 RepID=A0A3T1D7T7_9BACL|nr:TetR family transcriptional regulator [Cohnella abietis]BBI34133.1 TetR family transcriptional regulator [Cohnella abietis]